MAAEAENYHRRRPGQAELEEVFRLESERSISNDWVVRYGNRFPQWHAQRRKYALAKGKVVVCQWQDGDRISGKETGMAEIASAPLRPQTRSARLASRLLPLRRAASSSHRLGLMHSNFVRGIR